MDMEMGTKWFFAGLIDIFHDFFNLSSTAALPSILFVDQNLIS